MIANAFGEESDKGDDEYISMMLCNLQIEILCNQHFSNTNKEKLK